MESSRLLINLETDELFDTIFCDIFNTIYSFNMSEIEDMKSFDSNISVPKLLWVSHVVVFVSISKNYAQPQKLIPPNLQNLVTNFVKTYVE